VKIGTWFVKEGFLGYDYPAWAKYFGFYTDFSYHRLDFRRQTISTPPTGVGANTFFSEGHAATWAFMFACRCGLLPDAEVPFGRLQPYVAVGPALLFSSQTPKIRVKGGVPLLTRAAFKGESGLRAAFLLINPKSGRGPPGPAQHNRRQRPLFTGPGAGAGRPP
jgi:hypothetical protein